MNKTPLTILCGALVCFGIASAFADQTAESFEKKIEETVGLKFLLALPEGYEADDEKEWPLVVFLHGAGERGDDLSLVTVHGPPKKVEAGEAFPFILVSPQCPADSWWTDEPVPELIDHLEKNYRVDASRIYLTGLSMGGYGTWHFATRAPERFAAIAPVCGGGAPYTMQWIRNLPVWAFHGAKDKAVPVEESERLIEKLKSLGNDEAKLTVYPEAGHDSWTETYDNPALYEWLLSHSLKQN
ncbi:MAG: prolyl oligopeptidase family serine peptidase [Verrucomicrobiales bacterium]